MKSSRPILAACLTATLAAPLAACSPLDVFGPHANGEIMSLAQQAAADSMPAHGTAGDDGGTNDNRDNNDNRGKNDNRDNIVDAGGNDEEAEDQAAWRDMRAFHAGQLQDEARRLCGTDSGGAVPSTCKVDIDEAHLPAGGDPEELLTQTVAAADKVPDESVDLVVAQVIDALALQPVTLDPVGQKNADANASGDASAKTAVTDKTDLEAVRAMLAGENAFAYGLDIALAHADADLRERISALKKASEQRVQALDRLVETEHPDWAVPAPGYEFSPGHAEPANSAEAAALVTALGDNVTEKWRHEAAHAQSSAWREDAIRLAAHAQRKPE